MSSARKLALFTAGALCLALAVLAGRASAGAGAPFASVHAPIGVAATQTQLIVSEYDTGQFDSIDSAGNATPYSSIPGYPAGLQAEMYLAASPNAGGWTPNVFYTVFDNQIYRLPTSAGPAATPFGAPLSPCTQVAPSNPHSGITFDTVGTYGFDMIVVCDGGDVWRISSAGVETHIATVPSEFLESPAVAPAGFGPLAGQILAADENTGGGTLWAVGPPPTYNVVNASSVSPAFGVTWAEGVVDVPQFPCSFGTSGDSLFSAMFGANQVWGWPQTDADLAALGGSILVQSEFPPSGGPGISSISFSGGSYVQKAFSPEDIQHEGMNIVAGSCPPPPPPPTGIIAPTQTTCQDYTGGTAQTLGQVNYTVSGGKIGQGINPGVFFFYTKITTSSPNQVVTVTQTNTSTNNTPLFGILNGQAWLYPANCSSHTSGTVIGANDSGASYTIPTPGTYIIGIKYQTKTIAGAPAPVPADITYKFDTSLGGGTGASVLLKKK